MLRNENSQTTHTISLRTLFILIFILFIATALRTWRLNQPSYNLDELWTLELSTARGSAHFHQPLDILLDHPLNVTSLHDAPPAWKIWTTMSDVTHPPLYFFLLRIWRDICDGDLSSRLFSVAASVAAIILLFDIVRLLSGITPALWACAIMAVATPQIELARQTRNYGLLILLALLAGNALVRIATFGSSPRRLITLTLALLATLLTHYFSIGTIAALFLFALLKLPGRDKKQVILSFVIAALAFALCWGPFMWQQRNRFAASDETTAFLLNHADHHAMGVIELLLNAPRRLIANPPRPLSPITGAAGVLFIVPFFSPRRRPDLFFWGLWLSVTLVPHVILDLARDTWHLGYVRYFLLAGPAVYAILPSLTRIGWLRAIISSSAILIALINFPPQNYQSAPSSGKDVLESLSAQLGPNDAIVCVGPGTGFFAENQFLFVSHYLTHPAPIVLLTHPPTQPLNDQLRAKDNLYVLSDDPPKNILPGFHLVRWISNPAWADIWIMQPTR